MRKPSLLLIPLLVALTTACEPFNSGSGEGGSTSTQSQIIHSSEEYESGIHPLQIQYSNPLSFVVGYNDSEGFESIADPFVTHNDQDGYFYLAASNTYVHDSDYKVLFDYGAIWRSVDLSSWRYAGTVFPNQASDLTWLTGTTDANGKLQVNAPCLVKINNLWVYYYTLTRGYWNNPGIGLAYAPSPSGPWTNSGKLFRSDEIGVKNSSDQDVFVDDDGKVYMSFGSGDGIWLVELTEDGLALKGGIADAKENKVWIAGYKDGVGDLNNYEGANIAKKDGSYYLYLSTGGWDGGVDSKYHTLVGKSEKISGPYCDSLKRDLKSAFQGDDVLVPSKETATGVGHSNIYQDSDGQEWIFYHGYDQTGRGNPNVRILFCDKIIYNPQTYMPYVENHSPTYGTQYGPYVKEAFYG